MNTAKSNTNWVSLSDMMTGLMLVFLFIAVLYISQIQKREQSKNQLVKDYKEVKQNIYSDLNNAFKDKFDEWQMVLERDLTVKFNDPDVLFGYLSSEMTGKYKQILDEFIPVYIGIINKPEYSNSIKEIRIEGHTAEWDDYDFTIELSQERANSVLFYVLDSNYFNMLTEGDKEKIKFWITSNGLGKGRALDKNGEYTYISKENVNEISRRVEFRIVTSSEELVDEILNIIK